AGGDAAAIHQVAGENEERNRKEGETVDPGGHALSQNRGSRGWIEAYHEREECRAANRECDRYARDQQDGEDDAEDEGFVHVISPEEWAAVKVPRIAANRSRTA